MTRVDARPVDGTTFDDVERVLGARGGAVGCWCMFWRLTNAEINGNSPADNRAALRALADAGAHPGLLLYLDGEPVGWCSVAPREQYPRIPRTKGIEPDDPDEPGVWSLMCVYTAKAHRGTGVADRLIAAGVDYATANGATVIEAYPVVDPGSGRGSGLSTGTVSLFTTAGFTIHKPHTTGRRLVMRKAP